MLHFRGGSLIGLSPGAAPDYSNSCGSVNAEKRTDQAHRLGFLGKGNHSLFFMDLVSIMVA